MSEFDASTESTESAAEESKGSGLLSPEIQSNEAPAGVGVGGVAVGVGVFVGVSVGVGRAPSLLRQTSLSPNRPNIKSGSSSPSKSASTAS